MKQAKQNSKSSQRSNLSALIVVSAILILIVAGCSTQDENSQQKPQLIVDVSNIIGQDPEAVSRILGQETKIYPIREYGTKNLVGEGREYKKANLTFTGEYVDKKLVFMWIEFRHARITGTRKEILSRLGFTDLEVDEKETKYFYKSKSGISYRILLKENENGGIWDMELGLTVNR